MKKTPFITLEKAKEIDEKLTADALDSLKKLDGDTLVLKELTSYLLNRNY